MSNNHVPFWWTPIFAVPEPFQSPTTGEYQCARGERHGPIWYLTVTLGKGRTTGGIVPEEKVAEVRAWIENYHKLKDHLEKISEINRELLRRQRAQQRKHKPKR